MHKRFIWHHDMPLAESRPEVSWCSVAGLVYILLTAPCAERYVLPAEGVMLQVCTSFMQQRQKLRVSDRHSAISTFKLRHSFQQG